MSSRDRIPSNHLSFFGYTFFGGFERKTTESNCRGSES